jgi:hypothetical protein
VCVCVCVVCIHVLILLVYIRYICVLTLLPLCIKGNGLNVGLYGAVDLARLLPFADSAEAVAHRGTNFTCCTSTKVHILTDLARLLPFAASAEAVLHRGPNFTCFTSTKVQMLTSDAGGAALRRRRALGAAMAQIF